MKKKIFGIAIVVLFVVSILSGLFAPSVMGKRGRPEYPKDISDKFAAFYREEVSVLMDYVEQVENAYACIPEAAYTDSYIGREEAAYIDLIKMIEQEWFSYAMKELELAKEPELQRRGYYGPPEELEEVSEELHGLYYGVGWSGSGIYNAVFFVKYQGAHAYSYDLEASYESLENVKAHLEKAENLLIGGKIPTILPILPPGEDESPTTGEGVPGFEAVFAIVGLSLLAVANLLRRRG